MTSPRHALRDLALLLCSLAAAWPLAELSSGDAAVLPSAFVALAVVATGACCRRLHVPGVPTLVAQLVVAVAAVASALAARGISPTPGNVRTLISALRTTINSATAPLPARPEVTAMIIVAAAFVAVVVDYIGGTARMSLFVALPIAAPFLLTTTALGRVLASPYFVAAAASWALLLLAQSGSGGTRSSGDSVDRCSSESRRRVRSPWPWPTLLVFATMTAVAIVVGLVVAPTIPQRPTPALSQGGSQGVDTSVDFSRSLDLSKSLHSTNSAPVLQYTTTASAPGPLRVTTSSRYRDGRWEATALDGPFTTPRSLGALPMPGLDARVPTTSTRTSVTINGLKPPLVAVPAPLQAANFGNGNDGLRIVTASGVPVLSHPSAAYSLISRDFTARSRPLSDRPVTTTTPTVSSDDLDTASLPPAARQRIAAVARSARSSDGSPFGAAVALQRWFRSDNRFRYSLTLAPTRSEHGHSLDPLSNFLVTRQGYCTQFATAMVMAARLDGIPARMALGFLPGTESGTSSVSGSGRQFQVHVSDAHAWPELYFPGMGWTRFDPTPASRSGAAPAYAPDPGTGVTSTPSPTSTPSSRPTTSSSAPGPTQSSTPAAPRAVHPNAGSSRSSQWLATVMKVALVLILLALCAAILPLAGRTERRRLLRSATSTEERDEGHWHAMRWKLADLGLPLARNTSPRATVAAFSTDHPRTSSSLQESLSGAAIALENSRYAADAAGTVGNAAEHVTAVAQDEASVWARLRAALLPASGIEFFRRHLPHRRR